MKIYLTIALVALLFNFGAAKHVPRNLRTSASEDVVVQESAAESDLLDNNVVDNEALVSNNEESVANSVNLLGNQPELTLVQNAPTKTLQTVSHANLVSAPTKTLTPVQTLSVQSVPVQTATVQTSAPLQTVNVLKTQNFVKATPLATSKTVVLNQVPQQQTRYYQVPQQQVYTAPQQQVVYSVQQQPQTQQYVVSVPQQQVYQAQPQQQQQWVSVQSQPQQQLVSVQSQPQQQLVSVQAQPQNQQLVLLSRNKQSATSGLTSGLTSGYTSGYTSGLTSGLTSGVARTSNVWVDQAPLLRSSTLQLVQPAQLTTSGLTKTVARAPNPLVYQVQPSRQATLSRQTVLSGAQLSSDVAEESRGSDFVVQEAESRY